ncbi:hypothetical protein GMD78_19565 [Ornithinibacillus sp. L9]|uniref:Uncharacterized protein n=1 Tax=Ornithinibacillus caprae TaxID=2678566 RepID=A0A6N8FRT3_9BACI|nr:hypothetical protein [Ornithinibacillus caprae]MUK90558.1 hypothetical protein [Ornithinibacillus caprae]
MGYILPIHQHEYTDYQKRVTKARKNHYEIERPFKVILEAQYEEIRKDNYQINKYNSQRLNKEQPYPTDHFFIQMTGIGEYINEKV